MSYSRVSVEARPRKRFGADGAAQPSGRGSEALPGGHKSILYNLSECGLGARNGQVAARTQQTTLMYVCILKQLHPPRSHSLKLNPPPLTLNLKCCPKIAPPAAYSPPSKNPSASGSNPIAYPPASPAFTSSQMAAYSHVYSNSCRSSSWCVPSSSNLIPAFTNASATLR